ncbi:hypothetical protein EZS27_003599 [termite gut metagenome]|uniref:Phospholipase D-like domain-containing protein n=1 Tax=termite gut metagenome TaxID=433724 RepID=A0A5J4SS32_9ZZZZ
MNYYFDIQEIEHQVRKSKMYSERFENQMAFKVNTLKELCGRLPQTGEIFFIETTKSFTAFTFIVHVLKHAGRLEHLYIATYSTNERIINALLRWREKGLIGTIHLHVSETLKFRMPAIFERLTALRDNHIIKLTFAWSHKKVTGIQTAAGEYYVVEGSGNYGENALEEQYVFLQNKQIYEFRTGQN